MAKDFATVLGIGLILIGMFCFAIPGLLGVSHPVLHIAAGFVALWLGFWGSAATTKTFCIAFGAAYVLGELGAAAHGIHMLLGALFIVGGVTTKTAPAATPRTA